MSGAFVNRKQESIYSRLMDAIRESEYDGQAHFLEAHGLSEMFLLQIRHHNTSVRKARELAALFGTTPCYILTGRGPKPECFPPDVARERWQQAQASL